MMKKYRILALVIALTWVFTVSALGENTVWECPECGKKDNTGNFCGNCGHSHSSTIISEKQETASASENGFTMNAPVLIKNSDGSYWFTLEGAHILGGDWERVAKDKKGEDCMMISVQGICENIDCNYYNGYIPNSQIQKDIVVTDQDGFSFEVSFNSGEDGRYEVDAQTIIGQKKRVSLIYFAFKENTSVIVSVPGYDGSVEIELK